MASRLTLVEEDVAPRASLGYSSSELEVKTSPSIENSLLSLLQEQSFVSEVVVVVVVVSRVIGDRFKCVSTSEGLRPKPGAGGHGPGHPSREKFLIDNRMIISDSVQSGKPATPIFFAIKTRVFFATAVGKFPTYAPTHRGGAQ